MSNLFNKNVLNCKIWLDSWYGMNVELDKIYWYFGCGLWEKKWVKHDWGLFLEYLERITKMWGNTMGRLLRVKFWTN